VTDDADITRLLREQKQRPEARGELYRAVYDRLRRLARGRLKGRPPGQTLGTTALVHEAYVRLVDSTAPDWNDRNHFFAVAATAMRQIIVDEARRKAAQKRGGEKRPVSLDDDRVGGENPIGDLIDLDHALRRLEHVDARLCQIVEMRFFAGYMVEEIAELLGSSARTVKRDWRKARALLHRDLAGREEPGDTESD
jgi:RNA polymerase sigma factor (TIGR02999 family)